jgi:hypothetical protein
VAFVGQEAAPLGAQQFVQTLGGAQRNVRHFRGGWCGERVKVEGRDGLEARLDEAEQDIAAGRVVDEAEVWARLEAIA